MVAFGSVPRFKYVVAPCTLDYIDDGLYNRIVDVDNDIYKHQYRSNDVFYKSIDNLYVVICYAMITL